MKLLKSTIGFAKANLLRIIPSIALMLLSINLSYAKQSGDPLSEGLGMVAEFLGEKWGVAALFVVFIISIVTVAFSDDKQKSMKTAGIVCIVGVVVIGASKMFTLFGLDGALI